MPFSHRALAWLTAAALGLLPTSSLAKDWLLAGQKDDQIRGVLQPILPTADKLASEFDAEIVQVLDQLVVEAKEDEHKKTRNEIWRVIDAEAENISNYVQEFDPGVKVEKVKAFMIRAGGGDSSRALEAAIVRVQDDRIRIQKGDDKERLSTVVVAFDTPQPGDLMGVSIRTKRDRRLWWNSWRVAGQRPAARVELRLINAEDVAYDVFGHRFPQGMIQQEVVEKYKRHNRDVRIYADAVPPVFLDPYSPPAHLQSPRLILAFRGELFRGFWWQIKHWNQVASRVANVEAYFMQETDDAQKEAARIAAGRPLNEDVVSDIYHFVRDELIDVPSYWLSLDEDTTANSVLRDRGGSHDEKSMLFLAMLRSLGVAARLAWAHHPDDGTLLEDYPNWNQVRYPLVHMGEGKKARWYDLNCKDCPPGTLPPKLRGTKALDYAPDAAVRDDEVVEAAWRESQVKGQLFPVLYMRRMQSKVWGVLMETPGDPRGRAGWCRETLQVSADGEVQCDVESRGATPAFDLWRDTSSPQDFAKQWTSHRFPAATSAEVLDADEGDTLSVVMKLSNLPVPSPMDDAWILPAELVYGAPTLESWPSPRRSDFYIGRGCDREWIFRLPLPEGWEDVDVPKRRSIGIKDWRFSVDFKVKDGELVIRRRLKERRGRSGDEELLERLSADVDAIIDLETTPVVVQRKPSGAG